MLSGISNKNVCALVYEKDKGQWGLLGITRLRASALSK